MYAATGGAPTVTRLGDATGNRLGCAAAPAEPGRLRLAKFERHDVPVALSSVGSNLSGLNVGAVACRSAPGGEHRAARIVSVAFQPETKDYRTP